jgi:hypothetical protein
MVDQDEIRDELELVRRNGGGILRPVDVVVFAKDEGTTLHGCFEWDDSKAAHEHRLEQARKLIRVKLTMIADHPRAVRAYVSLQRDRETDGGGYRAIVDVMSDDEMREQLLDEALDELNRFRRKYSMLKALAPIFEATDQVRARRRVGG